MLDHLNSVGGSSRILRKPQHSEDREEGESAWLSKPENGHESESVRPVDSMENVLHPVLEIEGVSAAEQGHRELRTKDSKRPRRGRAADSMEGKGIESD